MAREYEVVGFKNVNYFSKKRNQQVAGTSLYVASEGRCPDVVGMECKEVWLNSSAVYKPTVGDRVHICYNERGYVEDVLPVPPSA